MRSFLNAAGHVAGQVLQAAAELTVEAAQEYVAQEVQHYANQLGQALAQAQQSGQPTRLFGSRRMEADVFVKPDGNFLVHDRITGGQMTLSANSVGVEYASSRGSERTTRNLAVDRGGVEIGRRESNRGRDRLQRLRVSERGGLSYSRETTRTGRGGSRSDTYVRAATDRGDNRSLEAGYYDRESEDRYSRGEGSVRTSRNRDELAIALEESRRRSYQSRSVRYTADYSDYSDDER